MPTKHIPFTFAAAHWHCVRYELIQEEILEVSDWHSVGQESIHRRE